MSQEIQVNSIIEGTVVRLKPFGAIIKISDNTLGLVHISHISNKFVQDVTEHLAVGDVVKAKVISIDPATNKIALSIKDLEENNIENTEPREKHYDNQRSSFSQKPKIETPSFSFEDKLKDWVKDSNDRHASINKRNKKR